MQVTVIIPNYNGKRRLAGCLDSLGRQTRPAARVVVVDNGSADNSREVAAGHALAPEVIALPENMGFAAAVNRGIEAAETEAVALLNNDAEADARWITAGMGALEGEPGAAMIASLMVDFFERGLVDNAGDVLGRDGRPRPRGRGMAAAAVNERVEVLSPCAGAAFYRREVFEKAGKFEESFFAYLEDVDLGLRARAAGMRCMFEPGAVVYHRGARTELGDRPAGKPVDSSRRVRLIARNRVRLLARNLPDEYLRRWSPFLLAGFGRSALYHLAVSRQGRSFFEGLAAGMREWHTDREYCHRMATEFADVADLMVRGERPWE